MKTLEIKKSWFYTAGRKWGWEGQGVDARGVGINRDILFSADKAGEQLTIIVDKKRYLVVPKQAIEFIKKYKSFYKMPGGTMIGVISKSLCESLDVELPVAISKKAEVEEVQPTLL